MTGAIIALAGLLLFTAAGQMLFKYGTTSQNLRLTFVGLTFLALATLSSFFALRTFGIGMVYLSMGFSHVLIMLGSWYFLGESINRHRIIGSLLVIIGILTYALSL